MSHIVWNILYLISVYGDSYIDRFLSGFSTKTEKNGQEKTLNFEIEHFLKNNAVQFAKEKKSITYVVGDQNSGSLLGYFTLTHKSIEVPAVGLSKTTIRKLDKHSK